LVYVGDFAGGVCERSPGVVATMTRKLTEAEQEAVAWAKQGYCHWRKRWRKTLDEHMQVRPSNLPEDRWAWIYDHPFGNPIWNGYVQTLHRLFADGVLR